jgi:hypothetical protein
VHVKNHAVNRSRGAASTLHFRLKPHDAVTAALSLMAARPHLAIQVHQHE